MKSPNIKLRDYRKRRLLTQADLARKLGVTDLTIGRWERGEVVPSAYYAKKLCAFFGASPEELGLTLDSAAVEKTDKTRATSRQPGARVAAPATISRKIDEPYPTGRVSEAGMAATATTNTTTDKTDTANHIPEDGVAAPAATNGKIDEPHPTSRTPGGGVAAASEKIDEARFKLAPVAVGSEIQTTKKERLEKVSPAVPQVSQGSHTPVHIWRVLQAFTHISRNIGTSLCQKYSTVRRTSSALLSFGALVLVLLSSLLILFVVLPRLPAPAPTARSGQTAQASPGANNKKTPAPTVVPTRPPSPTAAPASTPTPTPVSASNQAPTPTTAGTTDQSGSQAASGTNNQPSSQTASGPLARISFENDDASCFNNVTSPLKPFQISTMYAYDGQNSVQFNYANDKQSVYPYALIGDSKIAALQQPQPAKGQTLSVYVYIPSNTSFSLTAWILLFEQDSTTVQSSPVVIPKGQWTRLALTVPQNNPDQIGVQFSGTGHGTIYVDAISW